jgi:hypothetical protein
VSRAQPYGRVDVLSVYGGDGCWVCWVGGSTGPDFTIHDSITSEEQAPPSPNHDQVMFAACTCMALIMIKSCLLPAHVCSYHDQVMFAACTCMALIMLFCMFPLFPQVVLSDRPGYHMVCPKPPAVPLA